MADSTLDDLLESLRLWNASESGSTGDKFGDRPKRARRASASLVVRNGPLARAFSRSSFHTFLLGGRHERALGEVCELFRLLGLRGWRRWTRFRHGMNVPRARARGHDVTDGRIAAMGMSMVVRHVRRRITAGCFPQTQAAGEPGRA